MKKFTLAAGILAAFFILMSDTTAARAAATAAAADLSQFYVPYKKPDGIVIAQPDNNFKTSASQISILGACDYEHPLYLNGIEISKTEHGFFTRFVELVDGQNTFTFENNGNKKTLTVTKLPTPTPNPGATPTPSPAPTIKPLNAVGVINTDSATHRLTPDNDGELITPLIKGTVVHVTGETGGYLQIRGASYVFKEVVDIKKETELPKNSISSIHIATDGESYTLLKFEMPVNAFYDLKATGNSASLTVYDTTDETGDLPQTTGTVAQLDRYRGNESVTYDIKLAGDKDIIGYYAEFKDGFLIAGFKTAVDRLDRETLAGVRIVLDAGHGGTEKGTTGPSVGPFEKDVNLYVTLNAKAYLEERGATVILTRDSDSAMSLGNRVAFIRKEKPDISVSIHSNSMPVTANFGDVSGLLTLYSYNTGKQLALYIQERVAHAIGLVNRTPYAQNLALTRFTDCPAILIEVGFMSNPYEYEWLLGKETQEMIGRSIGEAIEAYVKDTF